MGKAGTKRGPSLKRSDFKKIKVLLDAGVPIKYITEITNRSRTTIDVIKASTDYQAYAARNAEKARMEKERRTILIPNETSKTVHSKYLVGDERNTLSPVTPLEEQPRTDVDEARILDRLTNIESLLENLLIIFQQKESAANVSFWKRGRNA